jgi:hypothetical protein
LANAVTEYWSTRTNSEDASERVSTVYQSLLNRKKQNGHASLSSSAGIAWLHKLGFEWREVRKGVFIDGHEKSDVVEYREKEFLPKWAELSQRMPTWNTDGTIIQPILAIGKRVLIPIGPQK